MVHKTDASYHWEQLHVPMLLRKHNRSFFQRPLTNYQQMSPSESLSFSNLDLRRNFRDPLAYVVLSQRLHEGWMNETGLIAHTMTLVLKESSRLPTITFLDKSRRNFARHNGGLLFWGAVNLLWAKSLCDVYLRLKVRVRLFIIILFDHGNSNV